MQYKSTIHDMGYSAIFTHYGESDHISRCIMSGEWYEMPLLHFLCENIEHGGLWVDVGAYIGTHTVFFAKYCADYVLSFEPNTDSWLLLADQLLNNNISHKTRALNRGISVDGRRMYCKTNPSNIGNTKLRNEIPDKYAVETYHDTEVTKHINDIALPVRLIKIDVEGMQVEVIKAFTDTIKTFYPALVVECEFKEIPEIIEMLPSGYKMVKRFGATPTYLFQHKTA